MANKHRGEVEIDIGGRKRKMRLSLNSLVEFQQEFNKPLLDVFGELDKLNILVIRSLLFYSLKDDDNSLTPEIIGNWDIDFKITLEKLGETLNNSLGSSEAGDGDEKKT